GELRPLPVAVDHRQHLVLHERPGPQQVVELGRAELLAQLEVVGGQRITDVGPEIHLGSSQRAPSPAARCSGPSNRCPWIQATNVSLAPRSDSRKSIQTANAMLRQRLPCP